MHTTIHSGQLTGATGDVAMAAANTPSPKLIAAAHEFEAQMMKELLKPLSSTGMSGLTEEDGGEGGDAGSDNALAAYATEAFGKALSNSGGFGVAKGIIASLTRSHPEVTATEHGDTRLQPLK